jgi:hypothetical protein
MRISVGRVASWSIIIGGVLLWVSAGGAEEPTDAAVAAAMAKEKADNDTFRANTLAVRATWSSWLCYGKAARDAAMAAIAKEKKYSRIGGVVNLSRLSQLQDDVRAADEKIDQARAGLRQAHAKPFPCSHPGVAAFVECARQWDSENVESRCTNLDLAGAVRVLSGADE